MKKKPDQQKLKLRPEKKPKVKTRHESGHWHPERWSVGKAGKYVRRTFRIAERQLELMLGPHNGRVVTAALRAENNAILSRTLLKLYGVQTIGEVQGESVNSQALNQ